MKAENKFNIGLKTDFINSVLKSKNSPHCLSTHFSNTEHVKFEQMNNYATNREFVEITDELTYSQAMDFLTGMECGLSFL